MHYIVVVPLLRCLTAPLPYCSAALLLSLIVAACAFLLVEQTENGKPSEHEHSSTMEHLRLLLHMVLSMARTQATAVDTAAAAAMATIGDEWQEDSGLGLYRAPEEGATAGACAAASIHSVSLEKKVSLGGTGQNAPPLVGALGFLLIVEHVSGCVSIRSRRARAFSTFSG